MNYQLNIRQHNKQAHVDIEKEIELKKNGLFTVVLRVNNGNIADTVVMEYKTAADYLKLKTIEIQEVIIKHG